MNVQLNDSGVPIIRQKTLAQKIKGFLLWTILIILSIAAALLVYFFFVGASEMAGMTTLKKVSTHPYYTISFENFDYSDMLTEELKDNDAVIKYYKKKFFKVGSSMVPGGNENETVTKGSMAFYGRTFIGTYMKGRIYNSYNAPIMMVTTKPQNGYKSWNIVDLTDVGLTSNQELSQWSSNLFQTMSAPYCVSEGVNQEGLSVSLVSCPVAECEDTALVNITPFMAVRLLLDRTATVESAIELLQGYDIDFSGGAYHFLISEKEENSVIVEYVNGKMTLTYAPVGIAHQVCTNKMETANVPEASKDFNNLYKELSLYDFFDSSLTSQYKSNSGMASSYAQLLLRDKSEDTVETDEFHFGSSMYGTQYTVFYDLNKMKMYIVIENDTKSQSYSYDLAS